MSTSPADTRSSLQRRLGRYSITSGMLAALLAGRASTRLIQAAATVLLLPVWGADRYQTFAAAMASFSWLLALVFTGPEKAVLKLLPRSPRTGAMITGGLVAVVWWLPLPLAATFGVVLWLSGPGTAAVYLGVAAMQLTTGCTLLLVGMHRAHGRPRADAYTFLTMSVAQLTLLAAAAFAGLGPIGFVTGVIAVQLALNVVLSRRLGPPSLELRHRPRFLGRLAWTSVLLSSPELYLYLSTAVLFTVLTASPWSDQISLLYVVVIIWSAGVNLLTYVFRVFAPRTSLLLAGRAGPAGRDRAARLAARLAVANLLWLGGVAVCLPLALPLADGPVAQVVLWVALLLSRAPMQAGTLWANYRLENTDATAPRVPGIAAVLGMAAAVAAALATVPPLGAVGVIISYGVGECVYTAVLGVLGRARRVHGDRVPVPPAPSAGGGQ